MEDSSEVGNWYKWRSFIIKELGLTKELICILVLTNWKYLLLLTITILIGLYILYINFTILKRDLKITPEMLSIIHKLGKY